MKTYKPTSGMKSAAKKGLDLITAGSFPVTPKAVEVGKKIASGQELSESHVNDMAHFHSSHDVCPKDCEDLLWGGPAGEMWAKGKLIQSMNTGFAEEDIDFNSLINDKDINLSLEIFSDIKLDEPTEETDDGLIWAPIARSGTLATRPGPNGEKIDSPLIFIPGHSDDPRKEIGLQDVHDAFQDKAHEHVTIPIDMRIAGDDIPAHNNKLYQNTGEILDTKLSDSKKIPGEKVLMGLHKFTEPDVKGKIERGTYPSRSCGLLYDYKNTTTGKVYPISLDHVALTHKPWMGGMATYGSAEFSDTTTIPMMLSESVIAVNGSVEKIIPNTTSPTKLAQEITSSHHSKEKKEVDSEFLADIQWGEEPSYRDIEKQISNILDTMSGADFDSYPQYYCIDCNKDKALVKVNYGIGPDEDAWVVPYSMNDQQIVELSPFTDWVDVSRKWVSDTIDPKQDKEQLDKLKMSEEEKTNLSTLTSKERKDLPKSDYVFPETSSYPIPDIAHARNALARVAQNGNLEEQSKVRAAVYKRYPELKKNKETSTKMSELQKASAKRLGLSESNYSPPGGHMTLLAMSEETMERLGLSEEAKELQRKQNNEIEKLNIQLAESQKKEKETRVTNRIAELKTEGFEAFSGLLKEIEATMMSDDGDIALKLDLSEHGHNVSVPETATDLAERFIKSLPRKDGKLYMGEFANKLETPIEQRPPLKPEDESKDEKASTGDDLLAQMLADDPSLAKDPDFLALSENGKGK